MADIRTLTVEGTTYNIKDVTARGDITTLQTNVTTLQTNVTRLQENTADLPQIRENVTRLQENTADLPQIRENVTQLQENTADLPQIRENVTQLQENTADLPQIRENVENNSDDIRDLKSTIAKNTIYDSASGSIASFHDGADDEPIKELIVNVDPMQAGSGDPSPDNIRPISGWTGVKITRAGKNLFDEANAVIYKRYFSSESSIYYWTYLDDSTSFVLLCKPNQTYTISCDNPNIAIFRVGYISVNPDNLSNSDRPIIYNVIRKTESGSSTLITGDNAKYLIIQISSSVASTRNTKLQIELSNTATAYEPYAGNTYVITFPSEAGTVYGGTLDVSTGELVVDRAMIASYNGESLPGEWISDRDVYASGATPTTGAQVVYTLATPITYTLTPAEIRTFLGQNNIWADTGDVTVTYRADTKLYIDNKITQAIAAALNS